MLNRTCIAAIAGLCCMLVGMPAAEAQTTQTRQVMSGGGGTTASTGHIVQGTLSQTASGRMVRGTDDRHDVGFWYHAYRPDVVTTVTIPHLSAEVGTHLTVPLQLTVGSTPAPFGPRAFHARIRFNHTLLRAAGTTPTGTFSGDTCRIEFDGTAEQGATVLKEFEFVAALGDSEATPIAIETFEWQHTGEERIGVVREDGDLTLLGVCRAGGQVRLIRSGAFATRISVMPNPASVHTTVTYVSAEAGSSELRIVDLLGTVVARIPAGTLEAERLYRQELDLSGIATGSYVLVLATPSGVISQPLLVTQ